MTGENLSINGLGGSMQSRYLTNSYNGAAGLDSGSFGDTPLLSFGNAGTYGFDSGMNMMGGMGMGYCSNPTQYIQYQKQMNQANNTLMEDNERFQLQRQVRQQKMSRQAQFATGASEGEITERIKVLKTQIDKDEQEHVKTQYAKLIEAVKTMYPEQMFASNEEKMAYDSQIKAYANRLYASTTGQDIETAIEERGDSQLVHGIKQGLDPFNLFTDATSAADNVSNVTGTGLSKTEISDRRTGKAIGYAGLALATGALLFALPFGAKGGGRGLGKVFSAWGHAWGNLFKSKTVAVAAGAVTP